MIAFECAGGQYLSIGAMAFNRLTALVFTDKHDLVWTPKFVKLVIFGVWILPAFYTAPLTFIPVDYMVDNVTGEVGSVTIVNENQKKFYFYSYAVFNVIVNGGSMFCYFMIFYTVRKHIKQTTGIVGNNTNWADVKLSLYGFVIAILLIIYTVTLILMLSSNHEEDHQNYNNSVALWTGISDVFSGCNPWFIIIFSKLTRDYMWKMFTRKSEKPKHIPNRGQRALKKVNQPSQICVAHQRESVDRIANQPIEIAVLPHEIRTQPNESPNVVDEHTV